MYDEPMDTKALQLESRFSLPPNSKGYCGKTTATTNFRKCIIEGQCDNVMEEVTHFITLHPYLRTLQDISGKNKFSYQVIESYWLGNDLLSKTTLKQYFLLLKYFSEQGVPDFLLDDLKKNQPKAFIPNHLFQVLHVGVGRASGAVPFTLESINNCMIRWGKVIKIANSTLRVNLHLLKMYATHYILSQRVEEVQFDPDLLPGVKTHDTVAVHWKKAVKILDSTEEHNLSFWTNEVLTRLF